MELVNIDDLEPERLIARFSLLSRFHKRLETQPICTLQPPFNYERANALATMLRMCKQNIQDFPGSLNELVSLEQHLAEQNLHACGRSICLALVAQN